MEKGYSKMILLLEIFWLDALFKSFYQKRAFQASFHYFFYMNHLQSIQKA